MRISLVLCTYNGARFLPAQLESLAAQTRLPDEIMACDDASNDATLALLNDFATRMRKRGVEVCLHQHPETLGFVGNFSDALRRTSGDVVFLCDQDDLWHPEKIERMATQFAHRPHLELLHTDADLIDANGQRLGHTLFDALEFSTAERRAERSGHAFEVLLRRNTVTGATTAFRRRLVEHALPVPDAWIHDEWIAICAALHGEVDYLDWPSIGYRQHGGNQIGIRRYSRWERLARRKLSKRAHMQRVAERLQILLQPQRTHTLLNTQQRDNIHQRATHAHFRANLSTSLRYRVPAVLSEAASGRYWRYSAGLRSIVSDLLDWG